MNKAAPGTQGDFDAQSMELVDLLWKLKKHFQKYAAQHISLSLLIKDPGYRRQVVAAAAASDAKELRSITGRIQAIDIDHLASALAEEPAQSVTKPVRRLAWYQRLTWLGWGVLAGSMAMLLVLLVLFWPGSATSSSQVAQLSQSSAPVVVSEPKLVEPELAVAPPVVAPVPLLPVADPLIVLRLHGSNTIGERLAPALVKAFLTEHGATALAAVPGKHAVEQVIQAVLPNYSQPVGVEIFAHGSSTAFQDLSQGLTDIGMASRSIKDAELKATAELGHLRGRAAEHVLGLDGLAIVVHPENVLEQVTLEQLAGVFSGQYKSWAELGGPDQPINIYARNDQSGTWDTFKELVLAPFKHSLVETARRYESSGELVSAVTADRYGIGFVALPYVKTSKVLSIAETAETMAVLPTEFTVSTEDYPLSRRLYLYLPAQSQQVLAREFIDFALAESGQKVVREIGLVAQMVETETPKINAAWPSAYATSTAGSERLSLNFRFRSGSDQLDNKAMRDLDRVVSYLGAHPERGVLLFGFTDSQGSKEQNLALSLSRAQQVERQLAVRGIYPSLVQGYGEALPLASNEHDFGRNKNRRVEIWVR